MYGNMCFEGREIPHIKRVEAKYVTKHPTKPRIVTWPKMLMVLRLSNHGVGSANSFIQTLSELASGLHSANRRP